MMTLRPVSRKFSKSLIDSYSWPKPGENVERTLSKETIFELQAFQDSLLLFVKLYVR